MLILDNQIDKFHAPVTFVHRGGKLCPTMSPKMVHRMCDRNLVLQTNYRRIWRVWVWLSDISMKDAIWISNNAIRQSRLSRRSETPFAFRANATLYQTLTLISAAMDLSRKWYRRVFFLSPLLLCSEFFSLPAANLISHAAKCALLVGKGCSIPPLVIHQSFTF